MTTSTASTNRRPRSIVLGVACALVLVLAATWWFTRSDERRVSAACDAYLQHREPLRNALSETDEAIGRAIAAKADRTEDRYFNDADRVRSGVDQWLRDSPAILDSLDESKDASGLERGAVQYVAAVGDGFVELQSLLEKSTPNEAANWLSEAGGRMQLLDDTCLSVARSSWI